MTEITADILLKAYMCGIFPMAETRDTEELFWIDPKERGVLPLDSFHVSKSLVKAIRNEPYVITADKAFARVIRGCAAPRIGHEDTWINGTIMTLYEELYERCFAHSIECWQGDELVGGLYGVSIGAAFFGESMFHTKTNASKIALCYLVARLKAGGFTLLDTQFVAEHLNQFGVKEIARDDYLKRLETAIEKPSDFYSMATDASSETILQLITQIS